MSWFNRITGGLKSEGSAFVKAAEHDAAILAAKGKVLAIQALHKAAHVAIDELEVLSNAVHDESAKISARLAKLDASL